MDFKTIAFTFGIIALPVLQIMPDVSFLQGLEKVGIIGFLSLVMIWLVWERRFFMTKTTSQMITMQTRLTDLENKVALGDEKIVGLLNAQLQTLREIKDGQSENFSRMWALAMREKKNEIQD